MAGLTAHTLAMSIAVGVYGGVFPVWGAQSLVCTALGVPLGAHVVVYVAGDKKCEDVAPLLFVSLGQLI